MAEKEEDRQPPLEDMALKAVDILQSSVQTSSAHGFFLMIEGSRIDMAGHGNDPGKYPPTSTSLVLRTYLLTRIPANSRSRTRDSLVSIDSQARHEESRRAQQSWNAHRHDQRIRS